MTLCLAVFLSACETVDSWTNDKSDITVNNLSQPAKLTPVASSKSATLNDSDLRKLNSNLSNASVEIYDLDGGSADMMSGAPIAPVSSIQMPAGQPLANNPSVTVYPLDEYAVGNAMPSAPYPAASPWPSPMQSQNEGPASWGGDVAVGGKMNSSAGKDISRVYFPYGSARLDTSDKTVLRDVAETAKFAPVDRVRVEGHASTKTQTSDPIKARILNLKESMNRAYEVSRDLIEQGVPAEKIKTVGWGDTVSAGSEQAQRRVDVVTGAGQ